MGRQGEGRDGISQQQAVFDAIEELGHQSSLDELCRRASINYGRRITENSVSTFRSHWRGQNNVWGDCRTNKGQPRRNMLNDEACSIHQVKRLRAFFVGRRANTEVNRLLTLLGDGPQRFHSVEQLQHALSTLAELQLARAA